MALNITEFVGAPPGSVYYQAARLPAVATQDVAVTAGSVQSQAFNAATGLIRVCAEEACRIVVGADPTATATSTLLSAGVPEYFCVSPGHELAVIEA